MIKKIKITKIPMRKAIEDGVEKALVGLGLIGVTTARMMSPVDTGLLSNSITWAMRDDKGDVGSVGVKPTGEQIVSSPTKTLQLYIGTNVEYAPYMEYGSESRNIKAQPFLLPARVKIQKVIDSGYVDKKVIEEIAKHG